MPARQRRRRPPPGARDLSAAQNVRRPERCTLCERRAAPRAARRAWRASVAVRGSRGGLPARRRRPGRPRAGLEPGFGCGAVAFEGLSTRPPRAPTRCNSAAGTSAAATRRASVTAALRFTSGAGGEHRGRTDRRCSRRRSSGGRRRHLVFPALPPCTGPAQRQHRNRHGRSAPCNRIQHLRRGLITARRPGQPTC